MDRLKTLLFAVAATALFFGAVEAVLWGIGIDPLLLSRDPFAGFSARVRVFEKSPDGSAYRTVPRATRHSFNPQQFRAHKPAGGYRVFVLGGSSSYGFPWGGSVAFAHWLETALRSRWPDRTIEVVNASGMSYGSHRLRILAHEVLDYAPDAIVFYEGHNEFIERGFYRRLLEREQKLDRVRELLYRWRLFSLLVRAKEALAPARPEPASAGAGEMLGLDVVREDAAQTLDADKARAASLFEENVRAIQDLAVRRGVRVVLCTVPVNLKDWAPNQSVFGPETPPAHRDQVLAALARGRAALAASAPDRAIAVLEEARALAPGYAETSFRLAQAFESAGRWDDARQAYSAARDADAQPSRALAMFNTVLRRLGSAPGSSLVDVERAFEAASPHGLVGFNLIEDYVHPNREGHKLIALALWQAFTSQGFLGESRPSDTADFWRAVGGSVPAATAAAPEPGPGAAADTAAGAHSPAELYNLGLVFENRKETARALQAYQECLALDPRYYAAACNLGQLLDEQGRPDLAVRAFRQALAAEPRHVKSMIGLGSALVELHMPAEAEAVLRQAVEIEPNTAAAWDHLGLAVAYQNRPVDAEGLFRRAIALAPDNYVAQTNLGSTLLMQRRPAEAITPFRAALAVRHDHVPARNGLADALRATGQVGEAARLYRETLAANPGDARAKAGLAALGR